MNELATSVVWRRWKYSLTPQHDLYKSIAKRFELRRKYPPRVLEVGFGTGAGILQYARHCAFVDAIEPDPEAVQFAKEMFPVRGINWIEGDILSYVPKKRYDVVVMVETLEHIPDWELALEKIVDLLEPQGDLFMTARNANADLRRETQYHEREWAAQELEEALSRYFEYTWLFDWTLNHLQKADTTWTPLIAIARKSLA